MHPVSATPYKENEPMIKKFTQQIQDNFAILSKSERALANFLLTNPDCLMVESATSLASKVGVSTMTVSRFIRKIGFKDFSQAKKLLKEQFFGPVMAQAGGIEQRYQLYGCGVEFSTWEAENLELELGAIRQVHNLRKAEVWGRCVELLVAVDAVYLASYQVVSHIAIGFGAQLEFVRPRVRFLDGLDANYSQLFSDPAARKLIVIIDTYPYHKQAKKLAILAAKQGIDTIVICDEFCHWAREVSENVLSVTTNTGLVFRSKAALSILTSLLTNDVIRSLGESAAKQMQSITLAETIFNQSNM